MPREHVMFNFIAETGGTLIVLMFVHFFADLMMQTDAMARRKADESPWFLIIHSAVYAVAFIPVLMYAFKCAMPLVASSFLALMMSHGAIDTYTPIWLWARFLRRPQEMKNDPTGGFTTWSSKAYGLILTTSVDQFMHMCFLVPVAAMIVTAADNRPAARIIGLVTLGTSIGLTALSVATILFFWRRTEAVPPNLVDDDEERPSMPSQHDE